MTETATVQTLPSTSSQARTPLFYVHATLLSLLICGAIAPTLTWLQFSNGSEGLNVGTVQEMYRTDQWLVPTLQGSTRLAKPPLTAWLTASAVTSQTVQDITSTDQAIRDQGFIRLAWETRWPTLLAGLLTLLLTAELGRLIAGNSVGMSALVAAGTSLLFLRFIRYSSTDVQLMLWVVAANVCIAHVVLRGRFWTGCIAAGVVLGMGMLAKGPLVLLQSVVPFALWMGWDWMNSSQSRARGFEPVLPQSAEPVTHGVERDLQRTRDSLWPGFGPVLVGAAVFLAVGMSWFIMVYLSEPKAISIWIREMTREGATESPRDPFYRYLSIFPLMMPWIIFLFLGILVSMKGWKTTAVLPLLLTFVPLIIMSIAKDKAERYVLPMLPAAAILVGLGLREFSRQPLAATGHWIILAALAIAFPLITPLLPEPWATPTVAGLSAIVGTLLLCVGIALQRTTTQSLLYTTLLIMLGAQFLFINGYRQTREGSAELKPLADMIWNDYPSAKVWHSDPRPQRRAPTDVVVYLNRVVENAPDPSTITQTDQPQIIILEQGEDDPDPVMPPPWRFLESYPRDDDWWWAYLLPPQ